MATNRTFRTPSAGTRPAGVATTEDPEAPERRVGRRTLVRGAAWTAPVVLVGAPTPAFAAASGVNLSSVLYSCGNGTWQFTFSGGTVTVTSITVRATWTTAAGAPCPVTATTSVSKNQVRFEISGCGQSGLQHYGTSSFCTILQRDQTTVTATFSNGETRTYSTAELVAVCGSLAPTHCPCNSAGRCTSDTSKACGFC